MLEAGLSRFLHIEDPGVSDQRAREMAAELSLRASTARQSATLAFFELWVEEDIGAAKQWADKAVQQDPTCTRCQIALGDVLLAAGQLEESQKQFEQAQNRAHHGPSAYRDVIEERLADLAVKRASSSPSRSHHSP